MLKICLVQDELRKKTAELEAKEAEHKKSVETAETEHKEATEELNKKIEELTKNNSEVKEQRDELEKQLNGKIFLHRYLKIVSFTMYKLIILIIRYVIRKLV